MNRAIAIVLLGLSLMVSPLMANVAIGSQMGTKIGVVDPNRVVEESIPGKRIINERMKATERYQIGLEAGQKKIKKIYDEAMKAAQSGNNDKRLETEFAEQEKIFRQWAKSTSEKIESDFTRSVALFWNNNKSIIGDVAKAEGISHVFNGSTLIWSEDSVDITNKVIPRVK